MLYNNGKEISSEEAHELKDKSGLCSSDKEIKFKKVKALPKTKGATKKDGK